MSEPAKEKPFPKVAEKPQKFALTVTTEDEYSVGEWRELPCGLEVKLAPAGTGEAAKVAARMAKKHGARTVQGLAEMKVDKAAPYSLDVAVNAHFLDFRAPDGLPVEINGEVFDNSLKSRLRILRDFPTIRRQIEEELERVNEEFRNAIEDTGKN